MNNGLFKLVSRVDS